MEISIINPHAHRRPDGIWNDDDVPALAWGLAERRVIIPEDCQYLCGLDVPVLRWARSRFERVLERHGQPIEVRIRQSPSEHIAGWRIAGPGPGKIDNRRVFFPVERRWCVAVIGRDRNGSHNLLTIHGPSGRNCLPDMMAMGDDLPGPRRSGKD